MIIIKTPEQINGIRKSCKALARLFEELKPVIRPGVTTKELDAFCVAYIKKNRRKTGVVFRGLSRSSLYFGKRRGYPRAAR